MPRWTTLGAALALGMALSACAPSAETGFPDPTEVPTEDHEPEGCAAPDEEPTELEHAILVLDDCYRPQIAVVAAGTEVVWSQDGTNPHTVTMSDGEANSHPDCTFADTGSCMREGDEFRFTFEGTGEFQYYCVLHGTPQGAGMAGTIVVE